MKWMLFVLVSFAIMRDHAFVGGGPNRFAPGVPAKKPSSIRSQIEPMIGTKVISIHHPDLSRSCQRLMSTRMAGMIEARANRPRALEPLENQVTEELKAVDV
jgi:hypothetical protein